MSTPYGPYVEGREPVAVMQDTLARYRDIYARTSPPQWQASWAPGKWTRHQVLVHVTQWELIFGTRVRMALAIPDYVVQPMDHEAILALEAPSVDVATAFKAFEATRAMHIALVAGLPADLRAKRVTHPERGAIDLNDLIVTLAGHAAHHLAHL